MSPDGSRSPETERTIGPPADALLEWHRGGRSVLLGTSPHGLELRLRGERPGNGVRAALGEVLARPVDRRHPIARILKGLEGRPGPVVDATAGLGGDTGVALAASDRTVLACESQPLVGAVLLDACRIGREVGWKGLDRLRVRLGDARAELERLGRAGDAPALVIVDPMFPPRRKGSALPPKPMQRLRDLADGDPGTAAVATAALLEAAAEAGAERVVLKRPPEAAVPDSRLPAPTFEIETKLLRWVVWERPRIT